MINKIKKFYSIENEWKVWSNRDKAGWTVFIILWLIALSFITGCLPERIIKDNPICKERGHVIEWRTVDWFNKATVEDSANKTILREVSYKSVVGTCLRCNKKFYDSVPLDTLRNEIKWKRNKS